MKLNKNQFDVLDFLLANKNKTYTQRELAKEMNLSLGTINKVIGSLELYLSNNKVNDIGLEVMEQYRVKRAVFLCAGFGSRMVPVTLNTPKPLVRIRGVRLIDTLIEACLEAEIEEIYIVRGYLGEQFDQLLTKFPNIKFIDNEMYNETNNISSAYLARNYLSNAYVLEGDLLLYNKKLVKKYQFQSNYLGVKVDRTDDWCFDTNKGIIINTKIGGENVHHMYGISYWTEDYGLQLKKDIETVFNSPGGKERFWDMVPLTYKKEKYIVHVRECSFSDITEIDTYNELKEIDPLYT